MIDTTPLPFISKYIESLNKALKEASPVNNLTFTQRIWLGFCLMGILMTNTICWAKFERLSFGSYTQHAISWMFKHSKINWDCLLHCSIRAILNRYGINKGILVVDDKDLSRSKNAKKIFRLHKIKDKKTGGYFVGQNMVFLYFVTEKMSIPVGFSFYAPDPARQEWEKNNIVLRKAGMPKFKRPRKPKRSADYPKKYDIALSLLKAFREQFSEIKVIAVLADNLYGHLPFVEGVESIWEGVQVITKMRKNQNIRYGKKIYSCGKHFDTYPGWDQRILIRGRKNQQVLAGGGRLYVPSHKRKRFVIAIKYVGEENYRYLMASNLTWNMKEIIEMFSLRWLIEVFFEDWSSYQGFCSLAKQCGVEGSERPLILSLLFDHCFFFHEEQQSCIENRSPLATFGSLLEKTRANTFCRFVEDVIKHESPKSKLQELADQIDDVFELRPSNKHLNGGKIDVKQFKAAA